MISTSRSARLAKWLSVPVGLVISALLIWQASYAAFRSEVEVTGNLGTAGLDLSLTGGPKKFEFEGADNLVPGQKVTRQVGAAYSGSVDADLRLYATDESREEELAEHLHVEVWARDVHRDDTSVPNDHRLYTGTLAKFSEGEARYTVPATEGISATIEFTFTLDPNEFVTDVNELMNENMTVAFVGEAISLPNHG